MAINITVSIEDCSYPAYKLDDTKMMYFDLGTVEQIFAEFHYQYQITDDSLSYWSFDDVERERVYEAYIVEMDGVRYYAIGVEDSWFIVVD